MSQDNSENEVKDFPVHQMKIDETKKESSHRTISGLKPLHQRVSSVASILTIGILVTYLSQTGETVRQGGTDRGIASPTPPVFSANSKKIGEKLKAGLDGVRNGRLIFRGHKPDLLDQFLFGELDGEFAAKTVQGKIKKVYLASKVDKWFKLRNEPSYYLDKFKKVFAVSFDQWKRVKVPSKQVEVFELSLQGKAQGKVQFSFDENGNFTELTVL